MLNLPARSTPSGLGWSFSSRGRGSSVVNRLLLHPSKCASSSGVINVELSDDDDNEGDDDAELHERDAKTRTIPLGIDSPAHSCVSSDGTTSRVMLDLFRDSGRVETVEGISQEPRSRAEICKPEPKIPPGLEQVAVKMQQATEIMETQLYKGLAEFRASMQWLSKTESSPSQVHTVEAPEQITASQIDNQNSCSSVLPTSITSLSPSHSAFLVTLAETLQLAVRAAEKLLQQAYADLRVLKERKSVIVDAQKSIQQTEERLEYLLATIQLFSSLRSPHGPGYKDDAGTIGAAKGPFRMCLPDIAEEEETAVVGVGTSGSEVFS